jgi:hypothetical protein
MRDEDYRRGSGSNLISAESRGPLGWGEKQALAMQAKNRRLSDGNKPEDDERAHMRRITVHSDMKRPQRLKYGG